MPLLHILRQKLFQLTVSERNKMKKISVIIAGRHYTSITLEEEFYEILLSIAKEKNLSINALVTEIDINRKENNNLSSAIRIFILEHLKQQIKRPS